MSTSPLSVGIVGAGRVGAVLGAALAAAGHEIVAASGESAASRRRIAELLPTTPVLPAAEVAARARLVIVSVPDDALTALVTHLSRAGALGPEQVVAHTSGAHGLGALAPAVVAGATPLALHPAMTFTGTAVDLERLRAGVSFGVTAPTGLRAFATRIVADLGGAVEWIAEEHRVLYHAALAHGSNHLVTLANEAMDRLRDAGVTDPARVLAPLLRAALDNALRLHDAALTGPVSRGDAGTVTRHLVTLGATAPESVPAYLALARRTADRAIAAGRLRPAAAAPLLDVLAGNRQEATA
ncbi:DUF2520 domain-containing protein [Planosporangium thailandense]|uniref:DUF2520 domain-containing protein n=1 Tax=Planosporangium thailandense TaxID=765197 RepID=A0ABX0Y6G1_9ACTN|nr:DUF2520 domain-containing protein [Planosporangium thailandense]NJC73982.1 DUF2520 domain-containing protein [Planosporangium thailandense]